MKYTDLKIGDKLYCSVSNTRFNITYVYYYKLYYEIEAVSNPLYLININFDEIGVKYLTESQYKAKRSYNKRLTIMEFSELKFGDRLYCIEDTLWYYIEYISPNNLNYLVLLTIKIIDGNSKYYTLSVSFNEIKNFYLTEAEYKRHKRCSIIEELL